MRFFICLLSCLLVSVSLAQTKSQTDQSQQKYQDFIASHAAPRLSDLSRFKRDSQAWNAEPWTKSDAPYLKVRDAIDTATGKGTSMEALAKKYKALTLKNPRDRTSIFGWGYAAIAGRKTGVLSDPQEAKQISLLSLKAIPPDSYQYARLQFIVASKWARWIQLKPLASRLMKRNPDDYFVKYYWITLMSFGSNQEKQIALRNAQALVKKYPQRASVCGLLADVYKEMFFDNRDVAAGDKAVAEYQRYLRLTPPSDVGRENAKYLIKIIGDWTKKLRQGVG